MYNLIETVKPNHLEVQISTFETEMVEYRVSFFYLGETHGLLLVFL